MRGVFGAGVATYIEEANLYEHIEAIYASSAGSFAAAYLLSGQTRVGASIYYEDLVRNFVLIKGFWVGVTQRLINRFLWRIPKESFSDALNLERLFEVATTNKKLDVEVLNKRGIPFWIKVLDVKSKTIKIILATPSNLLQLMRASVWAAPYMHTTINVDGRECTDANAIEPIGFDELRRRHPDSKIVIVFCGDPYLKWTSKMKSRIEGFFAHELFGNGYYEMFADAPKHLKNDLEAIRADSKVLFLTLKKSARVHTRTRSARILKEAYQQGIDKGKELEAFL